MAQAAHELTAALSATWGSNRERSTDAGTGAGVVARTDSAVVPNMGADVAPGDRTTPIPCTGGDCEPAGAGDAEPRLAPAHTEASTAAAAVRRVRVRLVPMH